MTEINRVDQLVLQLRAQLQRLAKQRRRGTHQAEGAAKGPLHSIRERSRGSDHRDDSDYRRAFVRALLTEEFGDEVAQLPEFQQISAEVWRIIEEDGSLKSQLLGAIDQFDNISN